MKSKKSTSSTRKRKEKAEDDQPKIVDRWVKSLPEFISEYHRCAVRGEADHYSEDLHIVTFAVMEGEAFLFPELEKADRVWLIYDRTRSAL